MEFSKPLTLVQLALPLVCSGLLLSGSGISLYMAKKYPSRLYTSMLLLSIAALVFTFSEAMILGIGGMMRDWEIAIHFHQLEQLAGAFFLFGLPFFMGELLEISGRWKKIHDIISVCGLAFAVVCFFSIVFNPDLFVSSTVHKVTWMSWEADYGRGQEGPLYFMRDAFLTLMIFYSFVAVVFILSKTKNYKYLVFPLAGISLAILGGLIDIIYVYTGVNYDLFPNEYFSRFSLGVTMFVMCIMAGLIMRYVNVAQEVETAHRLITISEEKYRVLVEGTNDLIMTMDDSFKILAANQSTLRFFRAPLEVLRGKNMIELLHIEDMSNNVESQVVKNKLKEFKESRMPFTLKAMLKGEPHLSPKEYNLRFEYLNIEGKNEIIVKASLLPENMLLRYFDSETQKYVIGNYLETAEDISKRLVANLSKYMDPAKITPMRFGLREIIINAIEHGNLSISFEDKTGNVDGNYLDFVTKRQFDPRFVNRKVNIEFTLNREKVEYIICDDGDGFDYREILKKISDENRMQEMSHGRGLTMAYGVFDKVMFNEKGNEVRLIKYFDREGLDGTEKQA